MTDIHFICRLKSDCGTTVHKNARQTHHSWMMFQGHVALNVQMLTLSCSLTLPIEISDYASA